MGYNLHCFESESETSTNCELIMDQADLWHSFFFITNNFENYFKSICHIKGLILQRLTCRNSSSYN